MIVHLKITGAILIAIALVHMSFPKYFNWKSELNSLSLINKQLMFVHTFFIALMVFLMGLLCLTSASEIIETNLGSNLALGLSAFWSARLLIQLFGYSSKLWKGKKFETFVHIFLSILWTYLSVVFFLTYLV